jgi:tRNA-splicing endonuclease subunit Sen54
MERHELNGRELRQQLQWRRKADIFGALPQRGGLKDYAPDDSWLQSRKLENFYCERREILQEERVHTLDALATGDWSSDVGKVRVTKLSGKVWKNFGHTDDGGIQWLHPEEALFLMDEGSMEVYFGGVPLSLQKAYTVLLANVMPMCHYQAYAHLCRYGYIVQRHSCRFHSTRYERAIGLDAALQNNNSRQHKKRKLSASKSDLMTNSLSRDKTEGELYLPVDKMPRVSADDLQMSSPPPCDLVRDVDGPYRGWFKQVWVESCIEDCKDVAISTCNLPVCVDLHTEIKSEGTNKTTASNLELVRQRFDHLSLDESAAGMWAALKRQQVRDDREVISPVPLSSPLSILWSGDVNPLVRPSLATTAGDVLKQLTVIENVDTAVVSCKVSDCERFRVIFDVFLPDANFRKSDPGQPAVSLCIARQDEPMPGANDIVRLSQHCGDGTTLMFAVVDTGDITFYSFNPVTLSVDSDVALL